MLAMGKNLLLNVRAVGHFKGWETGIGPAHSREDGKWVRRNSWVRWDSNAALQHLLLRAVPHAA